MADGTRRSDTLAVEQNPNRLVFQTAYTVRKSDRLGIGEEAYQAVNRSGPEFAGVYQPRQPGPPNRPPNYQPIIVPKVFSFTYLVCGGGRGEWIRTTGLLVPNQALYQAEPRPDKLLNLAAGSWLDQTTASSPEYSIHAYFERPLRLR
jgi:hypothetical protein